MHLPRIATPVALAIVILSTGCRTTSNSTTKDADSASADSADTHCRVVLREAGQSTLGGGEVFKDGGLSWVVYRGVIDASTQAMQAGATVSVQYTANNGAPWTTVQAVQSADPAKGIENLHGGTVVPPGFTRLSFATTSATIEAGSDHVGVIQLIPFLTLPDGSRAFDHNRVSGNYQLTDQNSATIRDDFNVCPAADSP
jgi:hypothetical protein